MPTFKFTAPDGKSYTVNGPEGATQEQAFAVLQAQIANGTAQSSLAGQIPVTAEDRAFGASQPQPVARTSDPSLVDKLIGTGETALTLATGATGGTVGMLGGAVKGLAGSVMDGTFGTDQGVRQVEQAAGQGMSALTYQPRTQSGQDQAQALGQAAEALIPATGLTAELSAVGRAAGNAGQAARNTVIPQATQAATNTVTRIRTAAPQIAERVERTLRRNPDRQPQRAGGSAGAQGVEVAELRRTNAESLPVPIDLTEGQATRGHMETQFERETAKLPAGEKLRERFDEQRGLVWKNFDAFIDATETNAPDAPAVGRSVDKALDGDLKRDKAEVRARYKAAEKSPEAQAPVTLESTVQFLNESAPDMEVSKLLVAARRHAIKLGIAAESENGDLVATPTTVGRAELFRRAVGNATDYEPTNIRNSSIIKASVDTATEPVAGPLYRDARRARENLANKWENRGVVADLVNLKRGMNDRKVAIEDVFDHVILKGDKSEVTWVKRVLLAGDKGRPEALREAGNQAWRDLQGQTMRWLRDQSETSGMDSAGNRIPSFANLDRAVKRLDESGKLESIFGKQRAAEIRDLRDIVGVIQTVPPGSVNTSGTTATLLAAVGEAGLNSALTGLPVPVLTLIRYASKVRNDTRLRKRIDAALARRPRPQQQPNF